MVRRNTYRKFSYLTDIRGIKNAIGEAKGIGFPKQPKLKKDGDPCNSGIYNEDWFMEEISRKIKTHHDNSMEGPNLYGEPIFKDPIVGFVRGDDPLVEKYKEIIGPHHFTPYEIMKWQAENNGVEPPNPEDISVVCFILPLTDATKKSNREMTEFPSERWAQTRLLGEIFSQTFVREIVTDVMNHGVLAVAPDTTKFMSKKQYPHVGWASPWSHRHYAYAAGLGTFGIHDFFITEKGAAHRCGSFVVNLKLKPNKLPKKDIHANCLYYQGFKCLKCMQKCPVGAISENGHDKNKCYKKVIKTVPYVNKNYHIFIYGCGLCSVGTPCESNIPKQITNKLRTENGEENKKKSE